MFSDAIRDLFCVCSFLAVFPPKLSFPSLGARMDLKHNLLFSAKLNWEELREHLNHLWYFSLEKQDQLWASYLAVISTSERSRVRPAILQRICCTVPCLPVHSPGFSVFATVLWALYCTNGTELRNMKGFHCFGKVKIRHKVMEVVLNFDEAVFMLFLFTFHYNPPCIICSVFAVKYPTSVNKCC